MAGKPTPTVNAAFTSGTVDLASYERTSGWTVTRGTSTPVTTGFVASAGTRRSVLGNLDRRFDPLNLSGPYVSAGVSDLVPGVQIQHKETFNAVTYNLFTGYADKWPQQYPDVGKDQIVPFNATDAFQFLAQADIDIARPAEFTGQRIAAIITATGYAGSVNIDHGNATVGALQLGTVSAMSHISDCVMTEWGDLFVDVAGVLQFRSRDTIASATRSITSQATFTDTTTGLAYLDAPIDMLPIVNKCTVNFGDRGYKTMVQDTVSQGKKWGKRAITLSLPFVTKAEATQYANWIVTRYGYPVNTFSVVTFKPSNDPGATYDVWTALLARELSDLITIVKTPRGGGGTLTKNCWIRGMQHQHANGVWQGSTLWVQDASWLATLAHYDVSTYDGTDIYSL